MRISSSDSLGLGGAVLLSLVLGLSVVAKDEALNMTNVQGRVFMIEKDNSTIMVDTKKGSRRLIVYSPETKFRDGHGGKGKDSSWERLKTTDYISCSGNSDEKARLIAKECVHHASK